MTTDSFGEIKNPYKPIFFKAVSSGCFWERKKINTEQSCHCLTLVAHHSQRFKDLLQKKITSAIFHVIAICWMLIYSKILSMFINLYHVAILKFVSLSTLRTSFLIFLNEFKTKCVLLNTVTTIYIYIFKDIIFSASQQWAVIH